MSIAPMVPMTYFVISRSLASNAPDSPRCPHRPHWSPSSLDHDRTQNSLHQNGQIRSCSHKRRPSHADSATGNRSLRSVSGSAEHGIIQFFLSKTEVTAACHIVDLGRGLKALIFQLRLELEWINRSFSLWKCICQMFHGLRKCGKPALSQV